jgi:ParB family chromosome partitioning protein
MENRKRALGRGLEQLFSGENLDLNAIEKQIYETSTNEEIMELDIDELRANPYQPRKIFNDEALRELAESIKEHGVFQPIIVKKSIKGYEIIAGERRVRASRIAGLTKVPSIIRQFSDDQMMEIALLENLQRENLSSIEEAQAYKTMIEKLDITQDELAKKVGKSRSHLTNMLGLLRLPNEVQEMVVEQKLSMSHARVLSKLDNDDQIIEMAKKIVEEKMSVYDIERISSGEGFAKKVKIARKQDDTNYKYVEDLLRDKLDAKVKIKDKKIIINFTNVADLNRILEIINIEE